MIFFYNDGLVDLDAIRTMGVSVKQPGSFGMFGTGLKYAIATVLRGGGTVLLCRGADTHEFTTESRTIRDQAFDLVCLDGEPIGFTTQLGRNWKAWMVLREFGCNARDEGGDFAAGIEGRKLADFTSPDVTVFAVDWDDLDSAYKQRADLFLEGEPLFENEKLRILPGPSRHLFYRGVRVFELEKPAAYTYDLLEEQMLTEDRTLYGNWNADLVIRSTLLTLADKATLEAAVCAPKSYHESTLDFDDAARWESPSRAFLDTVIEARESGNHNLNESAKRVLLKHMRKAAEDEYSGGYRRIQSDAFAYAIDVLDSLGVKFTEGQAFITVDELQGESLTLVEGGRIYVLNKLLNQNSREIAMELLKRWVDLQTIYTAEQTVALLGPLLLNQHSEMKRFERLIEEDEKGEPLELTPEMELAE